MPFNFVSGIFRDTEFYIFMRLNLCVFFLFYFWMLWHAQKTFLLHNEKWLPGLPSNTLWFSLLSVDSSCLKANPSGA
jgi:hypothetical protein